MLRFLLFSTFSFLFLFGCNSERADMRRIESYLPPMMLQLGKSFEPIPGAFSRNDVCRGMTYDMKSESVICVGYTNGSFAEPSSGFGDALIIKFDRKFNISWMRQFGAASRLNANSFPEQFRDVKTDLKGNIYLVGDMDNKYFAFKMDSHGSLLWQVELSGICTKIQVADSIYCSGLTSDAPGDAFMAKISFEGHKLWEKILTAAEYPAISDTSLVDLCQDLAISPKGIVACLGITFGKLTSTYTPIQRDGFIWLVQGSDGSTIDVIQVGTKDYREVFSSGGFDREGNLFVLGEFSGSGMAPPDTDFFPSELNPTKSEVFVLKFQQNGTSFVEVLPRFKTLDVGQNSARKLLITRSNKIVVCIQNHGDLYEVRAEASTSDLALALLDPETMSTLATRKFGALSRGRFDNISNQTCEGLSEDVFGNIIAAGDTEGSTNDENAGVKDIMIWRVGPDLELQ